MRQSAFFIIISAIILTFALKVPQIAVIRNVEPVVLPTTGETEEDTTIVATTTIEVAVTQTTKPTTTPKITQKATTTIAVATSTPPKPTIVLPPPDFEIINKTTRAAMVNILCTTKGGELSPITGTGIIIDSKGLILTNAHLGQYFLLKNFQIKDFLTCIARTGSPAYPTYNLELVYISPAWIDDNKTLLTSQNPTGTGEHDFAFLRITGKIDGSNLPPSFPYVNPSIREVLLQNESVLLASYPAGFLGGLSVLQDLSLTSAIGNIKEVFTFDSGTIDLISIPGTVVSQKGSSGGAIVDGDSRLIGTVVTSTIDGSTSTRDLRAITLAYINRDLQSELGMSLEAFMSQDISSFAKKFQETTAPTLSKILINEILK